MNIALAATVLSVAATPRGAAAQRWEGYDYQHLAVRAIGLGVGFVGLSQVDPTLMAETRADLGFLGPRVRIMPGIGFWASALHQSEVERLANQVQQICERQGREDCAPFDLGQIRISDLVVNLDGHFILATPPVARAYLGSGLGFHFLNGQGEFIDDTFIEDLLDNLLPSVNFSAGVMSNVLAPLHLYGELRYVLMGEVQHGEISFGALWQLPATRSPAEPTGGTP